jgi:hypothetical protein
MRSVHSMQQDPSLQGSVCAAADWQLQICIASPKLTVQPLGSFPAFYGT